MVRVRTGDSKNPGFKKLAEIPLSSTLMLGHYMQYFCYDMQRFRRYMRCFHHYMRYFCNHMQCFRLYMRCFRHYMWWFCHYMK